MSVPKQKDKEKLIKDIYDAIDDSFKQYNWNESGGNIYMEGQLDTWRDGFSVVDFEEIAEKVVKYHEKTRQRKIDEEEFEKLRIKLGK